MIYKFWLVARSNFVLSMLSFELFWIVVILLDKLGSGGAGGVAPFVYVNF